MEDPNASSPIAGDGGGAASADSTSSLVPDPGAQLGSAHGTYQNDGGPLSAAAAADGREDAEFGFQRPEFGQEALAGTVGLYERHLFLCYKGPRVWPSHVEAAEFDRLPRLLSAALKTRKADIKKQTRITLCEGEDGTESSNGDVLIFPDMIRYRQLTHFDVDTFVEEVLVKDTEWFHEQVETLTGSYIFVCSHGSRDKRCGVCGPALIKRFKEEIKEHGLQGEVTVSACSHIGGHKYAGNVIIFSPSVDGAVAGHWYGYVSPDDVPVLLEHVGKGEVVTHLWRGQMGLSEQQQKKAQERRVQLNGDTRRREWFEKILAHWMGFQAEQEAVARGRGIPLVARICRQKENPAAIPLGMGFRKLRRTAKRATPVAAKVPARARFAPCQLGLRDGNARTPMQPLLLLRQWHLLLLRIAAIGR